MYQRLLQSTVGVTGWWGGRDSLWEQEKLDTRIILENGDESHQSSAPMMMASDHFIQEDEGLRPENALLAAALAEDT